MSLCPPLLHPAYIGIIVRHFNKATCLLSEVHEEIGEVQDVLSSEFSMCVHFITYYRWM